MAADARLLYEALDGVARVTLNRPDKLNAMTPSMIAEFLALLRTAEADPDIHAVVVRGAGRAFCTGHDLSELAREDLSTPEAMIESQRQQMSNWMQVWNLRLPVIAAVHGYCLGGGLELALHCDFILAADDASFGYPPARAGLPDTQMFAFRLGTQWAKRLLYTGDSIDSQTAERIGLALKVVPRPQLEDESMALARAIASVPQAFVQGAKRVLNAAVERLGLEATATQSHHEYARARQSDEISEFSRIARDQGTAAAIAWRNGQR